VCVVREDEPPITRYIPVAFAYPGLAPSGFLGENGNPRTFGVSLGVGF